MGDQRGFPIQIPLVPFRGKLLYRNDKLYYCRGIKVTVSKVVCIPDMSALQNLRGITIGGRDIREWLINDLEILITPRALKELDDGRRSLEMEGTLFNKLKGFARDVEGDITLRDALNEFTGQRLS